MLESSARQSGFGSNFESSRFDSTGSFSLHHSAEVILLVSIEGVIVSTKQENKMSNRVVNLESWGIIVNMSAGRDYLALHGIAWGHPNIRNGEPIIPGTFASFDRETMTGISLSGTKWYLDPDQFQGNGNARTLEDAIQYIEKNWIKK